MTGRLPVIIESPYAGDVPRNTRYVRQCLRNSLLEWNEAPFASHSLYTLPGVLDDLDKEERALGMLCGNIWRFRALYTVFYTDRGWSPGMLSALHDHCLEYGHPFFIRAIFEDPQLPATLDEDIEQYLRIRIQRREQHAHPERLSP